MSGDQDICNGELQSKDGRCERPAKYPDGRCGFHTENKEYGGEDWNPNYEHGLYQDRSGYYKHLPEEDQKWIDAVTDSFVQSTHEVDRENDLGKLEKLRQVAIDLHKRRRADEYIAKKGMTQTNEVGFHEQYGVLTEEKENVLHITADRLSRESRMTLKDLGVIGNDKDKNAEDIGNSVIEALSGEVDE